MGEFDGKVALVTGGGRGIGQAVGELLLSRGAKVASFDLDASGSPDGAVPVEGDATDSSSVADAVARGEREGGAAAGRARRARAGGAAGGGGGGAPSGGVAPAPPPAGAPRRGAGVPDDEW